MYVTLTCLICLEKMTCKLREYQVTKLMMPVPFLCLPLTLGLDESANAVEALDVSVDAMDTTADTGFGHVCLGHITVSGDTSKAQCICRHTQSPVSMNVSKAQCPQMHPRNSVRSVSTDASNEHSV